MPIIRRKFPNYPVALAIAFCVANIAHAQLCLTAAERNYLPVFTGKIDLSPTPESKSVLAQISQISDTTLADAAVARVQDPRSPEAVARALFPTTALVQKEPAPAFRLKDELLQKLLIAASQPTRATADLQSMFAE